MAEPIVVDNGSLTDYAVLVDDVVDGTLGTGAKQLVGLMDATIGSTTKVAAGGGTEANALRVTIASDSTGLVSVDDNGGSLTVDGTVSISGTVTVQDNASLVDNAGFTDGTSRVLVAGFIFDEVAGTALTENDAAAARIDSKRAQIGIIEDATTRGRWATVTASNALKVDGSAVTQPVSDAGGSLTVDGSVSITGAVDTELPAAAAISADNTAAPTAPSVYSFPLMFDGTNWDRMRGTSVDGLLVDLGANNDVVVSGTVTANAGTGPFPVSDNAGSLTVDAPVGTPVAARLSDGTAFLTTTGGRLSVDASGIELEVGGPAAADSPVGANPVVIGGRASTATPTPVSADGDAVHLWTDRHGAVKTVMVDDAGDSAMDGTNNALRVNVVAGSGSGTEYVEDAVTPADPQAGALMLRRRDAPVSEASAAGDWVAADATQYGAQFVQVVSSGGAFIDSFGGSGGTAQADKSAFTEGTTTFTPVGGVFNETITADPTEDQAAAARITAKRALHANLRNASGTEIGTASNPVRIDPTGTTTQPVSDAGGSLTVDGTVSISGTVTVADASLDNATLVDNAAFTDGTTRLMMAGYIFDETAGTALTENDAAAARVDSKRAQVFVIEDETTRGRRATVTASNALKVDGSAVTQPVSQATASSLNAQVVGPAAHDAAVSGNPVRIAAKGNTNEPTAVSTDGDTVDLWSDLLGRLVILSGHPNPEPPVSVNATASGNTTVIAAPGASLSLYINKVSVHNRDASNRLVALQDGAGGTTRWRAELASEGGGSLIDFGARGWKLTANTLLNANLDAAGNVDVNVTEYYIAP